MNVIERCGLWTSTGTVSIVAKSQTRLKDLPTDLSVWLQALDAGTDPVRAFAAAADAAEKGVEATKLMPGVVIS